MQRADQAHGKGNGNAKTAQNHAAAGVVHGRERVHHRNTHARAHHRANRRRTVRFHHHPPLHLMFGKQAIQKLPVAVGLRQADIVLTVKIRRRQLRFVGKRVAGRQHADLIQRQQLRAFRSRWRDEGFGQTQIVALGRKPLLQQRRLLRHDGQTDLRIAGQKRL